MIFNILKKNKKQKIGGEIAYYKLEQWWLNEFSSEERKIIRNIFKPLSTGSEEHFIDKGTITFISQSKVAFLSNLLSWFTKKEYYCIAKKIISEAEKNIDFNTDILDKHFFYLNCIKAFYSNRENYKDALDLAIDYCKKQISISKKAKEAFLREYSDSQLPIHTGFKQLAIIYEKDKKYDEALIITKQALLEGWNNDSEKRIERLEKKLEKIK